MTSHKNKQEKKKKKDEKTIKLKLNPLENIKTKDTKKSKKPPKKKKSKKKHDKKNKKNLNKDLEIQMEKAQDVAKTIQDDIFCLAKYDVSFVTYIIRLLDKYISYMLMFIQETFVQLIGTTLLKREYRQTIVNLRKITNLLLNNPGTLAIPGLIFLILLFIFVVLWIDAHNVRPPIGNSLYFSPRELFGLSAYKTSPS
ncbi:hypothetical protein SNEBB_010659 [Seison nebaliae]|nr:hypothetical protein SNEBB_010659 [Seison nebaliae]